MKLLTNERIRVVSNFQNHKNSNLDFQVPNPQFDEVYAQELRRAISRTRTFFMENQNPEGYWVAELEGDALLQSETIMLLAFLGEENSELARFLANDLVEKQLPDGGWGMYVGAEPDIHNTVKGYFALKLTGHDPSSEYMQRAKSKVRELGGIEKVNSFTRFYLAILGQIPHNQCPAVPPQMMFLPKWFPINIYAMSSWSRTIFVPLSIVSALRPVKEIPAERGIRELFTSDPNKLPPVVAPGRKFTKNIFSWDFFFRSVDKAMWYCRNIGFRPLHKTSIEMAKKWMLDRFEGSDGPGAIYPPIIWSWIALKALGYADDSKEVRYCRKQLDALVIWEKEKSRAHVQPCRSPVWDTSLTLKSLMIGGMTTAHPMIKKGVDWIRSQQLSRKGDWHETVKVQPGGWCFEFNNEFYPDNDDTAMALMVLRGRFDSVDEKICGIEPHRLIATESASNVEEAKNSALQIADLSNSLERGVKWLLAMQNKDGGWAAFDRNNNREMLCRVPFADHNAMIDPSSPDLTGRVLESLGRLGYKFGHNTAINKAVNYMKRVQRPDGSWFGRWGVNYIYGTWQGLTGLTAVGVPINDPAIQAGKNWLLAHQQPCGGWGETPNSYIDDKLRGTGTPTASQTAWAVMGLIAAGLKDHKAVYRGIRFLLDKQNRDGTWDEKEYTGTGFPLVFYLRYHYYRIYFPLMALSLYANKSNVANLGVMEAEHPGSGYCVADNTNDSCDTDENEPDTTTDEPHSGANEASPEINDSPNVMLDIINFNDERRGVCEERRGETGRNCFETHDKMTTHRKISVPFLRVYSG
ncbi:MAG: terpene cyclase/mutase family protein [Thermoguttaceae bacterium]